jgi:hypothetical protein
MDDVIDNERNYFPKMEAATDEEWEKLQPMLDKAKAEGNPWAFAAGIFRNDPLFDEWVEEMRLYRQRVEEEPELWHDSPS